MKYLYVGFKGKNNPSSYIVSKFQESFLLTNSYLGIDKDISKITDCKDGILLFGLKPKMKNKIQIEMKSKYKGEEAKTTLDISYLLKSFNEVEVVYNEIPSNYLCNYAYHQLLKKFNGNAILIHIPFQKDFLEKILKLLT